MLAAAVLAVLPACAEESIAPPRVASGPFDGQWRGIGTPVTIAYGDGTFCTVIKLELTVSGGKIEGKGKQMRFGNRTVFMGLEVEAGISDQGVLDGTLAYVVAPRQAKYPLNGRVDGAQIVASSDSEQCHFDFIFRRV